MSFLTKAIEKINIQNDYDIWKTISNYNIPTGMTAIDFMSANLEKDEYGFYTLVNGGFGSKASSVVGSSSSGKSTIVTQWAGACVDYANRIWKDKSEIVYFDIERYMSPERIKTILGWTDTDLYNKLILYQDDKTNVIDIYNEIKRIADEKEKRRKDLLVKTPIYNLDGSEHYQYAPTFVIIDSIAMLTSIPETKYDKNGNLVEDDQISKNTEAMTDAKNNTNFIKKVKPLCSKYGIVLIMINHITDEIKISMFDIPTKQLPFLKPGQKISGGKELIYQSASLIGLLFGEKLDEKNRKYGEDIHGSINKVTFYKNKNGIEGITFPLVQNAILGYMPELSDFELLTDVKYGLSGVGNYTLQILPELGAITKKTCYNKCQENSLYARAIQFTAKVYLAYSLLYKKTPPNLSSYVEKLSFEERVALVLTFSDSYPRYHYKDEIMEQKYAYVFKETRLKIPKPLQSFFGEIGEAFIDFLMKGYIFAPQHSISIKDRLNPKQIIKRKDGLEFIKVQNKNK